MTGNRILGTDGALIEPPDYSQQARKIHRTKRTHLEIYSAKGLDVARPLISLWRRIDPSTEEGRMLENAIELWAEAHFFISKDRIDNVMNSVYSIFKNFLKDP